MFTFLESKLTCWGYKHSLVNSTRSKELKCHLVYFQINEKGVNIAPQTHFYTKYMRSHCKFLLFQSKTEGFSFRSKHIILNEVEIVR